MRRAAVRLFAGLTGLLLTLAWLLVPAVSAQAAGEDSFDRLDVQATLDADGYLQVTETIVLRFGANSGRHGLEVRLRTREPDTADYDLVYQVDHVEVSSPSGAPATVDLTEEGGGTRNSYLRVRVGDPDTKVYTDTATYVLSYRVLGLLRNPNGIDQLYWDVTGSSTPMILATTVKVVVPGGVQGLDCWAGPPGVTERARCAHAEIDSAGVATFAAEPIPLGQLLTVGVRLSAGAVANTEPIREQNAEKATEEQLAMAGTISFGTFVASGLAALVVPFVGWRRLRRNTDDLRFLSLPPGVIPAPGEAAVEGRGDRKLEIPVAFGPPKCAVAEAGYLLDGKLDVRDTTATLVGLATAGAVQLHKEGLKEVSLVDWSLASDAPAKAMLKKLFPNRDARKAKTVDLTKPGTMTAAHDKLKRVVETAASDGGWFARKPTAGTESLGLDAAIQGFLAVIFIVAGAVIAVVFFGTIGVGLVLTALATLPLVLTIAITWLVVRVKSAKGQRSGIGRALTDQVQGFRTYLATAEAEQLQFEEGEDIFSKYLPWAIAFDLTDRWTKVCQRLVELGRLSPAAPSWYAGSSWDLGNFGLQFSDFSSSMGDAVAAPVSVSSADAGFGSSSSAFSDSGSSDGGFSGGGGGGSDMGSW